MRPLVSLLALGALALAGCSTTPPAGWAKGGGALVFADASWRTPEGSTIRLRPSGAVELDGSLVLVLDRVGRVYDEDRHPVGVMFTDGEIAGSDDTHLGRVGVANAAPPGSKTAWLSVLPDGTVIFFDSDGERVPGGIWHGCNGPQQRTCTLVTHLVALRRTAAASRTSSVYMGFGVGIYR